MGHRPVDPCLSRRVSLGHPAGVPVIFSLVLRPFLSRFVLQIAADPPPPSKPRQTPGKQILGTVRISQNAHPATTFEFSQRRHCKERLPGLRTGFWVTSGSLSPKTAASIYTFSKGQAGQKIQLSAPKSRIAIIRYSDSSPQTGYRRESSSANQILAFYLQRKSSIASDF